MLDPLIGRQLGKYQIQQEIGRGGMARVYRAVDTVLQRPVALKVLAPSLSADPEFARRFEREAITAANLRHPAIVTIFDVGEADGLRYIAMEYIGGRTLNDVLEEHGKLGVPLTIAILGPVAEALDFAHSHGMVHRDVKPHNIMLDLDGRVLLTDFGIAIDPSESTERLTRTGMFMGTPEYISPEQAQAQPLTGRSDQYSLGIVAYEMLAGRVPFEGGTPQQIMAHVYQAPPRITDFDPQTPPEIDQIFARVLAKDPNQRFERTGQLVEALRYVARRYSMNGASREDVAALAVPLGSSAGQATVAMRTPTGNPAARNSQSGAPAQRTPSMQTSAQGGAAGPPAPFPIADVFGDSRGGAGARPATGQAPTAPVPTGGYRAGTGTPAAGNRAVPPSGSRQTGGRSYGYTGGTRGDDQFVPPPRVPRRRNYDDDGGSNVPWTLLSVGAIALVTIALIVLLTRDGSLFASESQPTAINPFDRTATPQPTATIQPTSTIPAPTPVPIVPESPVPGQSPPPEELPTPSPTTAPTLEPTAEPTPSPTLEPTPTPTVEPTVTITPSPFITETPIPTDTPSATATVAAGTPTGTAGTTPTTPPAGVPTPVGGGGRLAYFTDQTIVLLDEATGTSEQLLTLTDLEPAGPPAISPDGNTILLDVTDTSTNPSTRQIYAVDRKGVLRNLTQGSGDNFNPSWRPDGNAIVFASTRDGSADLYTMNPDGSNQRQLTFGAGDDQYPSYSPDGTRLVFESNRDGGLWNLYTMSPQGGPVEPLPRTTQPGQNANDRQPRWSPDGTSITFVSDRSRAEGSFEVFVLQPDKINVQQITTFSDGSANNPTWSPDGTLIAFYSDNNGSSDLYLVVSASKQLLPSPASDPGIEERYPSWGR